MNKRNIRVPEIKRLTAYFRKNPLEWEELLELYNPNKRARKRIERYEQLKHIGLNEKCKIDEDLFSASWIGLDQLMVNITTSGYKKEGVTDTGNKLDFLENLWLYTVKEADNKTKEKIKAKKEMIKLRKANSDSMFTAKNLLLLVVCFTIFLFFGSCIENASKGPADSEFMENCKLRTGGAESHCRGIEKRNKAVEKYLFQ